MKINENNYFEVIEKINSENIIRFKNISFIITKKQTNTNFKLNPNYLATVLTFSLLGTGTLIFASAFLLSDNEELVSLGLIPTLIIFYFSRKISLFFTEKLYKKQIFEFYNILKLYNLKKLEKNKFL